jgi:hypothetical protein
MEGRPNIPSGTLYMLLILKTLARIGATHGYGLAQHIALTPEIRRIMHELNANVPVTQVGTQTWQIDRMIRQERTFG